MTMIDRRSFLKSILVAAPCVVIAARLMPVRGMIMPVKPMFLPSEISFGHQWGRVRKVVMNDGAVHFLVDGEIATREQYDAAKFDAHGVDSRTPIVRPTTTPHNGCNLPGLEIFNTRD